PAALSADAYDDAADDAAREKLREDVGQLVERHLARRDLVEASRLPFRAELSPELGAERGLDHRRVDADEAHAAQDERHHGRLELRAARETDRCDVTVRPRRREQRREHVAADGVDAAAPRGLAERSRRLRESLPIEDSRRAEPLEI